MNTPRPHIMHVPGFDPERDRIVRLLEDEMGACIHRDPDRNGILWNYRRALTCAVETREPDQKWVLVGQDDAVPVKGWQTHLPSALRYSPAPFLSLCSTGSHATKLKEKGVPYGIHLNAIWGVMVGYHEGVLDRYLELVNTVADRWPEEFAKWDDGLTVVYNLIYGTRSAVVTRALFDHPPLRSTVGNVPGRHRHPPVLISDPGPAWASRPGSRSIGVSIDKRCYELAHRLTALGTDRAGV